MHRLDHEKSLEHLRHISQVEGVVRSRWGWQKLVATLVVHLDRALDRRVGQALNLTFEALQESGNNGSEDCGHRLLTGGRHAKHLGMPGEPRRHCIAAAAWRCRAQQQGSVLDVLPLVLLPVKEAPLILELPQQLDGRLGAVLLYQRHVHIIDEDHHRLVHWRTQQRLAFPLQLALDIDLRLVSLGLGAEGHEDRHHGSDLLHLLEQRGHVHALPHARVAGEEDRVLGGHHAVHDVGEAHGVRIRDQQLKIGHALLEDELGHDICPRLPLGTLVEVDKAVVRASSTWHRHVGEPVLDLPSKHAPRLGVTAAADGPGKGEAKEGLQEFLELCGLQDRDLLWRQGRLALRHLGILGGAAVGGCRLLVDH
mmetsp:Transcript_74186/g.176863  ORF Transcript_74186/g.176863 Transcript_74186/m.176863 type:complete len:367 (-) Transcript_74186:3375-4475(-)